MRSILRLFAFTVVLPFTSRAQDLTIGLNGGAAFAGGMHADKSYYTRTLKTEVYTSLTAGVTLGTYELALRLSGNPIEGSYHNYFINNMVYAQNPLEVMLQANRHNHILRFDVYSGLGIGMIAYKNPDAVSLANLYPTSEFASSRGRGVVAGVQAGCNYNLSRRIDLNLEIDGYYTRVKAENNYRYQPTLQYHFTYVAFPIAVGAKYKFGEAARKKK